LIFIETPRHFASGARNLDDRAFQALQIRLIAIPDCGNLIRGTHGLRKVRISLPGRGRRGGGRVVYYWWAKRQHCYLLYGYAKNVQSDLTPEQLKRLAQAMTEETKDG
jgi:hypothetical protein